MLSTPSFSRFFSSLRAGLYIVKGFALGFQDIKRKKEKV